MLYSYTGSEHKNMLDRFSIHQINGLSSCCYVSKVSVVEKRHGAMQKLFMKKKKKRKKRVEKNGQVFEISKTMGT